MRGKFLAGLVALLMLAGPMAARESRSVPVPANAEPNRWGNRSWHCVQGYIRRSNTCVPVSQADDSEIRKLLIEDSIVKYPGNCPCPYFTDRAGRSCGRRSAYSRAGGYSPFCYPQDVSDEMIAAFRKKLEGQRR